MKRYKLFVLLFIPLISSCFDDKGNYDYHEVAEITIEGLPELLEVVGGAEHIVAAPTVKSSLEGIITEDNPNFTFTYKMELKSGGTIVNGAYWGVTLNKNGRKDVNPLAPFAANTYLCMFIVTDVRTGRETAKLFDIKVTSPTYEGWMVLCNEGAQNRVRLDMISVLSKERTLPAYDLLASLGLPEVTNARMLGWAPSRFANPGDVIYLISEKGSYLLDQETFKTDESWNIKAVDFIIPPADEEPVYYISLNSGSSYGGEANFCVTDKGNAYCQALGTAGAAFEYPINTSERGLAPEFKVAPYVGVSMARPGNGNTALFYDTDNRRFVGWSTGTTDNSKQILSPLQDPEEALFSFKTGMELIYMESTRFSNGLVYAILQDQNGQRHIYGINMGGNGFVQESKYENLQAPGFDQASRFAFHSQFPFLFYAEGNKVHMYNLATNTTYESVITLPSTSEVTFLKFNLYQQPLLTLLNDQSEEFMARQFELMVGSYDKNSTDNNGGTLGFYKIDGINNKVSKRTEYSGFARIADVVYRERR